MNKKAMILSETLILLSLIIFGGVGGILTVKNINPIINQITGLAGVGAPNCIGLPDGCVLTSKPWICIDEQSSQECSACGCPTGNVCLDDGSCTDSCDDGTLVGHCSDMNAGGEVYFCRYESLSVFLELDCSVKCNCPNGYECNTDFNICEEVSPPIACGDNTCNGDETCGDTNIAPECNLDCGECPPACPDSTCNGDETCGTCPADCGECPIGCGDDICSATESCSICPDDCGACPGTCGDDSCSGTETCTNCRADCGQCESNTQTGGGSSSSSSDDDSVTSTPQEQAEVRTLTTQEVIYTSVIPNDQFSFTFKSKAYRLIIEQVTSYSVIIKIKEVTSNEIQTIVIKPGEEKEIDLNEDSETDIIFQYMSLIDNNKANVKIDFTTHEELQQTPSYQSEAQDFKTSTIIYIVIAIFVVIIAFFIVRTSIHPKKSKKNIKRKQSN